eukprot:3554234-Prymnesium_polylepis.2
MGRPARDARGAGGGEAREPFARQWRRREGWAVVEQTGGVGVRALVRPQRRGWLPPHQLRAIAHLDGDLLDGVRAARGRLPRC